MQGGSFFRSTDLLVQGKLYFLHTGKQKQGESFQEPSLPLNKPPPLPNLRPPQSQKRKREQVRPSRRPGPTPTGQRGQFLTPGMAPRSACLISEVLLQPPRRRQGKDAMEEGKGRKPTGRPFPASSTARYTSTAREWDRGAKAKLADPAPCKRPSLTYWTEAEELDGSKQQMPQEAHFQPVLRVSLFLPSSLLCSLFAGYVAFSLAGEKARRAERLQGWGITPISEDLRENPARAEQPSASRSAFPQPPGSPRRSARAERRGAEERTPALGSSARAGEMHGPEHERDKARAPGGAGAPASAELGPPPSWEERRGVGWGAGAVGGLRMGRGEGRGGSRAHGGGGKGKRASALNPAAEASFALGWGWGDSWLECPYQACSPFPRLGK